MRYVDAPVCRDEDLQDGSGGSPDGDCTDSDDEHLYYAQDANFNTTALVNASGTVVERYVYDPYGQVTIWNEARTSTLAWADSKKNEILFCGYRYDPETSLYHVRHRMYHSTLGRWLQRDPLGYVDGVTLYEYCQSGPGAGSDPYGLWLGIDDVFTGPIDEIIVLCLIADAIASNPEVQKAQKELGKKLDHLWEDLLRWLRRQAGRTGRRPPGKGGQPETKPFDDYGRPAPPQQPPPRHDPQPPRGQPPLRPPGGDDPINPHAPWLQRMLAAVLGVLGLRLEGDEAPDDATNSDYPDGAGSPNQEITCPEEGNEEQPREGEERSPCGGCNQDYCTYCYR